MTRYRWYGKGCKGKDRVSIAKVSVHKVSIQILREFAHSRSKKTSTNNIVVEIIAEQREIVGYGEGSPRLGVTGETQENAIDSIGHFLE
ncbi:MAG: hypothetical protein B1H12_01585 [Desulfobacteraceae bacterium 4484_190.2]|nr:MAG: hypothetical protein B1H12_01585 [Desulfobacteraceae bacterium 4484_190.2]